MEASGKAGRSCDIIWVLAFGIVSSVWCLTASHKLSAAFDEPTYLTQGLERWRTGECKGLMRLGTMPLPVDVETLPPLLMAGVRFILAGAILLLWARRAAKPVISARQLRLNEETSSGQRARGQCDESLS